VSFLSDYGQLVVEAKVAVNDMTSNPSANKGTSMQKELEAAMQAYQDGLTAWNLSLEKSILSGNYIWASDGISPQGKKLHNTYRFPTEPGLSIVSQKNALTTIWNVAKTHLLRATELAR
jgi:hypothetical protein